MNADHPYRVLVAGCWPVARLSSRPVASTFAPPPEVVAVVEATWAAAQARAGFALFDGPVVRLESWVADAGGFALTCSTSSYKWFFGTNGRNAAFARPWGPTALANAIGTSAALLSADGWLVFGRRAAGLALYAGFAHPLGGMLEVHELTDPTAGILRELEEEVGCTGADVMEVVLLGLGEDLALDQPELVWRVRTRLTRAALESRLNHEEHAGTWCVEATPEAVLAALAASDVTAITRITLLLYGRQAFGKEWASKADSASPAK